MEGAELSAPGPCLVFDCHLDAPSALPERLRARWQGAQPPTITVRLKKGTSYTGRLLYYDSSLLTLCAGLQEVDLWTEDISCVLEDEAARLTRR